jgi:hypothetical protein
MICVCREKSWGPRTEPGEVTGAYNSPLIISVFRRQVIVYRLHRLDKGGDCASTCTNDSKMVSYHHSLPMWLSSHAMVLGQSSLPVSEAQVE